MPTEAKVIADSISVDGHRLTTLEVTLHRFVLAELNTHRAFSRNSASSRAIPLLKQLQRVADEPAIPVVWPAEKPGMQGGEELDEQSRLVAEDGWVKASNEAIVAAGYLGSLKVHKSIANRLLEPFMWHTVVITATAWDNFFALRCNPMAQPEIRVAAEAMYAAREASIPKVVRSGEWHLPYIDDRETWDLDEDPAVLVKVSSARCARVSYLTQDGVRDVEKDIMLYNRLVTADPAHASPLEHVATPAPRNRVLTTVKDSFSHYCVRLELPQYGNLLGWHQHRFDVEAVKGYQAYS